MNERRHRFVNKHFNWNNCNILEILLFGLSKHRAVNISYWQMWYCNAVRCDRRQREQQQEVTLRASSHLCHCSRGSKQSKSLLIHRSSITDGGPTITHAQAASCDRMPSCQSLEMLRSDPFREAKQLSTFSFHQFPRQRCAGRWASLCHTQIFR